jgi:protein SCO1/2
MALAPAFPLASGRDVFAGRIARLLFCLVALASVDGCRRPPAAKLTVSVPAARAEPNWPLTGKIIGINRERRALLVSHDEVKGLMPAMTMEFPVGDGDLAIAREGHRIRATLVQQSNGDFTLEQIWSADADEEHAVTAGTEALQQDTDALGRKTYTFRDLGDAMPQFTLYDQEGQVIAFNRFHGKRVVLNFIYSRCPLATMCPASTLRMSALQKAAREAKIPNFELITVTLDPQYDTPGVLKEYAAVRGIDTSNFSFLTGPEPAIKNLLKQLGVTSYFEDGILKHSLNTILISETGKILYRNDTPDWTPEEFLSRLR